MKRIRVLLADDHAVVRKALKALLNQSHDLEVVGEAENGIEALEVARRTVPDVVVMDVAMPRLNGCEATRRLLKELPSARVLALSFYTDADSSRRMLQAGAAGYLTKQAAGDELRQAIRDVSRGKQCFRTAFSRLEFSAPCCGLGQPSGQASELTGRQAEVVQLVAEGYANKQIASELSVSVKTIEKHRQNAMHKLNLHAAADLTRYAVASGIVDGGMRATAPQLRLPA